MHDFESIYSEFRPKILRYLTNWCGEAEAADLAQAVFMKVNEALPSFRGDSSLATWIYKIATNTTRDHMRSVAVRQQAREDVTEDGSCDDFPDLTSPDTDQTYIRREMTECIRGIVDTLPENYRTVLLLGEFEGLSNAAIAEVLGESLATVKIRLHRSRAALRRALEGACTFYHDGRSELMCDRKQEMLPE